MVLSIGSSVEINAYKYFNCADCKNVANTGDFETVQNNIEIVDCIDADTNTTNSQITQTDVIQTGITFQADIILTDMIKTDAVKVDAIQPMSMTQLSISGASTKDEFFKNIASCPWGSVSNYDDFVDSCDYSKKIGKDYLGDEDNKSLFRDYMDYRECDSSEELKALGSVKGVFGCTKKSDLAKWAQLLSAQATFGTERVTSPHRDYRGGVSLDSDLSNDIFNNASVENLAQYVNSVNSSQSGSFADQVLNFQTFLGNVSRQSNISQELKNGISNYSQKVISCADSITSEAIAQKKSVGKDTSNIMSSSAYRALLISQYQS